MNMITKLNDAWILHREEIETVQDGICDVYVVLDAISGYCLEMGTSKSLLSSAEVLDLIKNSCIKSNATPRSILILKTDPLVEVVSAVCAGMNIPFSAETKKDLRPFTDDFKKSFQNLKKGTQDSTSNYESDDVSREEVEAFIPDAYSPCPCASGKKYKFCCQRAFKDIVFSLSEAQEGRLEKALSYMGQAESKIGVTAEILCRYGICWSFFDKSKSDAYLLKALEKNPNHPRTNYILGINNVESKNYKNAVAFYLKAIENYPAEDKFHLNETYNNLGTAYYELGDYKMAKESWEKALILLPSDRMVASNLFHFIYNNPEAPPDVRIISPFIEKFLKRK